MQQATKETIIDIQGISVQYFESTILDDVNLQINKSDFIYLVGGNGSGKSTLVKAILGLVKLDTGEIKINGKNQTQELISKNFAYVPQFSPFDKSFPITVEEIIRLECSLAQHCKLHAKDHLTVLGAEDLLNRQIGELSGGELQKVLISRALLTKSSILILDEPSNNLDRKSREELKELLHQTNKKEGTTIIYITHHHGIEDKMKDRTRIVEVRDKKIFEKDNH